MSQENDKPQIDIVDFQKLDLRVGKVVSAENVQRSQKLLKLEIDLGGEVRQILSGIALDYAPAELVGQELIIIANLDPWMMMGLESQGMILCADVDGKSIVLTPKSEVPPGVSVC